MKGDKWDWDEFSVGLAKNNVDKASVMLAFGMLLETLVQVFDLNVTPESMQNVSQMMAFVLILGGVTTRVIRQYKKSTQSD
jgi:purine-cytosine permease-like protein